MPQIRVLREGRYVPKEYDEEGYRLPGTGYWDPTIIECECGGGALSLSDAMTNLCMCGRVYNGSAQRLDPNWQRAEQYGPDESGPPYYPR